MQDLIDKISSYNLFNYLLPGILFVVFSELLTSYSLIQSDIIIGVFLYYFIGLVISRIGSLVIEPLFRKISLLEFAPYEEFVIASKTDQKLEVLSEANNMYRTFCSLFIMLAALKSYEILEQWHSFIEVLSPYIIVGTLFLIFMFSYRKQTSYITRRIKSNINESK